MSTASARPAQPEQSAPPSPPPDAVLTQMIFGKWVAMALSVAAKLRIADHSPPGRSPSPTSPRETGTHAPSLYRVLRAPGERRRVRRGRRRPVPPDPAGRVPAVRRAGVDAGGGRLLRGRLELAAVGRPARQRPDRRDRVRRACSASRVRLPRQAPGRVGGVQRGDDRVLVAGVAPAVAEAYDFSPFGTVVDVGGGHGDLLCTILKAYPTVAGRRVRRAARRRRGATSRSARPGWPTGAGPRAATSSRPCRPAATPT